MGKNRSKPFGVFQAAVVLAYGGLTACSALPVEPAPVSIFPVERITDAVTAGAELDALSGVGNVGRALVVGAFQLGHVDQHVPGRRLACQWV